MVFAINDRTFHCPVELTLNVIGGKWKTLILWQLMQHGTLRYSELRRGLPRITDKMLAQQLRELEADGLIGREVYPVVPPRVEYSLTDSGRGLVPVLEQMREWGMRFKGEPALSAPVGHG